MAGDWIKMRVDLRDDPAVFKLAEILNIDELHVIGCLFCFWSWVDKHAVDGRVDGATSRLVDKVSMTAGFADALVAVSWLQIDESGVTMPNFQRHNGESAKERGLKNARQARWRAKKDANVDGEASTSSPTEAPTREEKRREDISTTNVVDKSVRSEVAQVFEHWKSVMDSPKSNLDKKRKTAIEARLKDGFSVEDLKAAINGCRKTPHNMGDNDRGQKFNDIELICRNAPNVERFMNATGASPPKPKAERPLTAAEKYAAQRDAMRANHERTITGTATRIA